MISISSRVCCDNFLVFPPSITQPNSNWLPDLAEARFHCGDHPASAVWRNFLLVDGSDMRGRVTAMINPHLCDDSGRPYGQLGFFECIDDPDAARLLIEPAMAWLRDKLPVGGSVLAPMNFDTWHAYRLRTAGFEEPTYFMEPYNPRFYPALFTALGFAPISSL